MTNTAQAKSNVAEMPQHSLIKTMAGKYGLEANTFKSTVIKTLFPSDKQNPSNEQVAAFLVVANQYNLNPFIKEIYAFPGKGGGIIPIVSIDGWVTLINRHPQFDGVEFVDNRDKDGKLESVTVKIFRKDRSHPTIVTEYLAECKRNTDPWRSHESRMLRHKALIQGGRYAFGFAGIYDPDEAERIASSNVDDTSPVAIAVISEKQRSDLVTLAQRYEVVERLGEIVNAVGFDMLAHITVDKYGDVQAALAIAGGKVQEYVDAEVIEAEPVFEPVAKSDKATPARKTEPKQAELIPTDDHPELRAAITDIAINLKNNGDSIDFTDTAKMDEWCDQEFEAKYGDLNDAQLQTLRDELQDRLDAYAE